MEMQQKGRNVGEKEAGQPSRSRCQTGLEAEEHRIDITEISPRVKNWIGSLEQAVERTQSQTQWPKTPKVPQMLRGTHDFTKFYEPRVISISPYHHGKPHLHPGEMIKRLCARDFLADSKQDIKVLYTKNEGNIEAVKKCYDKRPTNKYDDEDLFLLENQLPFGVLKLIFEGEKFNDVSSPMEEINKFVIDTAWPERTSEILLDEPSHLLDHLRSALLGGSKDTSKQRAQGQVQQGDRLSFRHIKELKATGIHLKPSKRSSLTDISFKSYFFYGHLKLPPLTIDGSTKGRFLNMVAYEMCPEGPDEYGVTSYICFLDNIIDHADDVKELRSKHIISNFLGSDEEVAQIFNEIANDLVDADAYGDVKARIQEHYEKKVNTWMAQVLHDHFNSPWTIVGSL